jgi:uncharacterized membrane protein
MYQGTGMSAVSKFASALRKHFVSGLLVTVPLIITYLVLRLLFVTVDGLLNPAVYRLLGYYIPGLGVVVTLLLILLAGIVATNFIGIRFIHLGDRILARMPLVRIIYTAAKQLVHSLLAPTARAFSEVVLIEYPRKGLYAIGFLSHRARLRMDNADQDMALVFVPSTPTPFSGMVVLVPKSDIYPLAVGVEEAVKILVSGGVVAPELFNLQSLPQNSEVTDASG